MSDVHAVVPAALLDIKGLIDELGKGTLDPAVEKCLRGGTVET